MTDTVKATISIGDKTVTFEGPRDFVESQVEKYTNNISSVQQAKSSSSGSNHSPSEGLTEKVLVETKKPRNHAETVAVLAFWLAQNGKEIFTEDDIRKAYIRAVIRPPKVISQAIRDAKNVYDMVEPGPSRGTWRLTTHGDRTVRFDLPRNE